VHSKQIIHRDIKPDNLLVSEDDSIKICDFSVSQMFDQPDDRLTYSAGSPIFLAPELCAGYFSSLSLSLPHSHSLSLSICFSFVMLNILMCCTC
jgi:[calcium/calmodulin-dependent protein kinase] kinase